MSDLIVQLQELLKNVNEAENSPTKYDGALIAAQVWQNGHLFWFSVITLSLVVQSYQHHD